MEDLNNLGFNQWLKSRYLQKKHVFEGEAKREKDYSKNKIKVENTQMLHFDIHEVKTTYNAQVGGLKQELDTIYYHNPTSFNHTSILSLEGLMNAKSWEEIKFIAEDKENHPGFYCHVSIELIGKTNSEQGWYDSHHNQRTAIGVTRIWKSKLEGYDKDLINFYACIEVPEYAVRLNNMTLDERITASICMEKYNKIDYGFENSQESDIFQCWLNNNRTAYEKKFKTLKDIVTDSLKTKN